MSEFSKQKFTQSTFRSSLKKSNQPDQNFLDTQLDPIKLKENQRFLFKEKVVKEIRAVLGKLIPEDIIDKVIKGSILKTIFKKLGI